MNCAFEPALNVPRRERVASILGSIHTCTHLSAQFHVLVIQSYLKGGNSIPQRQSPSVSQASASGGVRRGPSWIMVHATYMQDRRCAMIKHSARGVALRSSSQQTTPHDADRRGLVWPGHSPKALGRWELCVVCPCCPGARRSQPFATPTAVPSPEPRARERASEPPLGTS